jgi:signal transduction histidine kinase
VSDLRARVLLADDTAAQRLLIRHVLEASGRFVVVAEAEDGRSAIDAASLRQPDLTLLDLSMPGMDGLEALPLIRQAAPSTVVVVMSAFNRTRAAAAAVELGASAYIEKGCGPDELVAQLTELDIATAPAVGEPPPSPIASSAAVEPAAGSDVELFASFASHDVLAPLAVVTGFLELLQKSVGERVPDAEYVEQGLAAARSIRRLLTELLEYAGTGLSGLRRCPVDVSEVVDDVVALLDPLIASTGATVETDDLPLIDADRTELRHLFQNLVHNALKFRSPGVAPMIRVTAARTASSWRFAIADNGVGVDSVDADRMFEPFERGPSTGDHDGTGLGLAIARRVVERHHGRIWYERAPSGGSIFLFTIADTSVDGSRCDG